MYFFCIKYRPRLKFNTLQNKNNTEPKDEKKALLRQDSFIKFIGVKSIL